MENGIEKKGSNRESEKREAVRDVLGRGCEYILGKMDFLYKAEQYPRWVWDSTQIYATLRKKKKRI